MTRLSVSIDANVAGFTAGMAAMAASARGAATAIDRSLSKTVGPTSVTMQKDLTAATEKLVKARVAEAAAAQRVAVAQDRLNLAQHRASAASSQQLSAQQRLIKAERAQRDALTAREAAITKAAQVEADAARKVQIAQSALAETEATRTRSSAARLRAESALADASARHAVVVRDTANEIHKANAAAEQGFREAEIAEKNHQLVMQRGLVMEAEHGAKSEQQKLAEMRATNQLRKAEENLDQKVRSAGLVRAQQNEVLAKSTRDLAKAQAAFNEASGVSGASATARLRAKDTLIRAEQDYASAVANSSSVLKRHAGIVNDANRDVGIAKARVAELAQTQVAAKRAAENLATAQARYAQASKTTAAATEALSVAQQRASVSSTRFGNAMKVVADNKGRIDGVANSMVKVGAVGAVGLGLIAAAAVNWEKNWVEVTKTVDFTKSKWGDSTKAMAVNEQQLRDLTKVLPATHAEIAQTAAMLGTLGVGANDLGEFTKVATQLGTTTGLSAEEAAVSLKQLMTVTGEVPGQVKNIGSALVALELDGASTSQQILKTGLRIASAGKSVGFATEDVLALGSSMASVGIQAEAGGNNMATTLTKIDRAVRAGGPALQKWADLAGMSGADFKQAWGKDAPEALAKVLDGLGAFSASGGNVTDMLRSMGIVNIREIRNMRDLALATKAAGAQTDLYRAQLTLARGEREKGTKLDETASKTYQTDAAKIQLALNNITDAAISMGGSLLPVIAQLANGVADVAKSFGRLDPGMQKFLAQGALFVSVGLVAGGALIRLATAAITFGSAVRTAAAGGSAFASSLSGLGAAAGPAAVALLAVVAAGAALDTWGSKVKGPEQVTAGLQDIAKGSTDLSKIYSGPNWMDKLFATLSTGVEPANNLGDAISRVSTSMTGPGWLKSLIGIQKFREAITPGQQSMEKMDTQVKAVDASLTEMVKSGNLTDAAAGFKEIQKQTNLPADKVASVFGGYREALAKVAEETYGVTLSQQELTDWMGGKVPQAIAASGGAMISGATEAEKLRNAVNGVRGSLEELSIPTRRTLEESNQLAQSLFVQGNLFQNAKMTHLSFAEAIDQASEVMKKNGVYLNKNKTALSDNTAKGRENITVLNNLATTGKAYVESLVQQGAGAKRVKDATQAVRDEFVKTGRAAGLTAKQAQKLADDYGLIPDQVSTKVNIFMKALDQVRLNAFIEQLKGLPPEEQTKIAAIYDDKGAKAALAELEAFNKKEVQPKIKAAYDGSGTKKANNDIDKTGKKTARPKIKPEAQLAEADKTGHKLDQLNAMRPRPKITPKANLAEADRAGHKMDELNRKKATPKITPKANLAEADKTGHKMDELNRKKATPKVTVKADTSGAARAQAAINSVHDKTVTITVQTSKAQAPRGALTPRPNAAGGYISGPGTATSDSIPAYLSNGEYVIRAAAVKAVGIAQLHAINAMGYAAGGPVRVRQRYATGGAALPALDVAAIYKLIQLIKDLGKDVQVAQRDVAAKLGKQQAAKDKAVAAHDKAVVQQKAAQDRVNQLQKEAAATKGVTQADRDLKKARAELAKANSLVSRTDRDKTKATDAYNKAASKQQDLLDKLKQAQEALADAAKQAGSTLAEPYRSTSHDIEDWLDAMQRGQEDLVTFNKQIAQLRKGGLNETLVQQIAAQGAIVGQELAGQILAGGKSMVDSLNKANAGLQKASDDIGFVAAMGVGRYASGGPVVGGGTATSDSIPARLSAGEYVVNAFAAQQNRALLDMINYGQRTKVNNYMPHYATGGYVHRPTLPSRHVRGGDVNFNGQINVIDPDQLMRVAKQRQRDSLVMAGLSVAV